MKHIPDGCIDMILCDLPYGTTACKWDTVIPFYTHYFYNKLIFLTEADFKFYLNKNNIKIDDINKYLRGGLWEQYSRIIKDDGAIVLTCSPPFTYVLAASNIKNFKHEWVWDKVKPGAFAIAKYRPLRQHEDILVFL